MRIETVGPGERGGNWCRKEAAFANPNWTQIVSFHTFFAALSMAAALCRSGAGFCIRHLVEYFNAACLSHISLGPPARGPARIRLLWLFSQQLNRTQWKP